MPPPWVKVKSAAPSVVSAYAIRLNMSRSLMNRQDWVMRSTTASTTTLPVALTFSVRSTAPPPPQDNDNTNSVLTVALHMTTTSLLFTPDNQLIHRISVEFTFNKSRGHYHVTTTVYQSIINQSIDRSISQSFISISALYMQYKIIIPNTIWYDAKWRADKDVLGLRYSATIT